MCCAELIFMSPGAGLQPLCLPLGGVLHVSAWDDEIATRSGGLRRLIAHEIVDLNSVLGRSLKSK